MNHSDDDLTFPAKLTATLEWVEKVPGTWDALDEVLRVSNWLHDERCNQQAAALHLYAPQTKAKRWTDRRLAQAILDGQRLGLVRTRGTSKNPELMSPKKILGAARSADIGRIYQFGRFSDEEFGAIMANCDMDGDYARARFIPRAAARRVNVKRRTELITNPLMQRTTLTNTVNTLIGVSQALGSLGEFKEFDNEQTEMWVKHLSIARVEITRVLNRLKGALSDGE